MKVLDASVVIKLLIHEQGSNKVRELVDSGEVLLVPDIIFVEIANTLATKTRLSPAQVIRGLELVYQMGFREIHINKEILLASASAAKKMGTAVYDMIYAQIAKKRGLKLITADVNFARKTGFDFITLLKD
jgi:predicted nucleic acid-binding protein